MKLRPGPKPKPLAERLAAHIDKSTGPDGCWRWTAGTIKGYGQISVGGTRGYAHRIAYELEHGITLTSDQHVLHRCDNPPCCNPRHLFLGDHVINMADKMTKGRHRFGVLPGERHGMHKLTADGVREIRSLHASGAANQYELADRFGVSQYAIWCVVHHRTWKSVQ